MFQTIMRLHHAGRSPLRRDGVAAHRIDLGHQQNFQRGVRLGGGDRGAEPGAACADYGNVHCDDLHGFAPRRPVSAGPRLNQQDDSGRRFINTPGALSGAIHRAITTF